MRFPLNTQILCVDASPVDGIKNGLLSITAGSVYTVLDFPLDNQGTQLGEQWVAIHGDNGGVIVCKANRFQPTFHLECDICHTKSPPTVSSVECPPGWTNKSVPKPGSTITTFRCQEHGEH